MISPHLGTDPKYRRLNPWELGLLPSQLRIGYLDESNLEVNQKLEDGV